MAVGLSEYGSSAWLGMLFGSVEVPAGYYVALLTGNPSPGYDGDLLAVVEVSGGGYARQLVSDWEVPGGGLVMNAAEIDFGVPTEDWGAVSGWALCSALTSGQVYAFGEFTDAWEVLAGQQLVIDPQALTVTLRAVDEEYS